MSVCVYVRLRLLAYVRMSRSMCLGGGRGGGGGGGGLCV